MFELLRQDLAFAVRSMRRRPGFALLVTLVLAVGIGTATAIGAVYGTVLLRPLPVRDQDRIVVMWGEHRERSFAHVPLSHESFRTFRRQTRTLSAVAAIDYNNAWPWLFRGNDGMVRLSGVPVSGEFFDVLGVRPYIGRALGPKDDVVGAPLSIVVSYTAWQAQFGSDPGVLGRVLEVVSTRSRVTIVGVMSPGFEYPRGTDFWMPLAPLSSRPGAYVDVVGRLRPGASVANARDDLSAHFRADPGSEVMRGTTAVASTMPRLILGDVRPVLRVLAAAVGILLLVSCVNVANLLLIRGVERVREVAVRSALGAARGRIVRQLMTESGLLALVGGALGALIAVAAIRVLIAVAPAELPRIDELNVSSALVWAGGVTIVVAVLFGLAPAVWIARQGAGATLTGSARWGTEPRTARLAKDVLVAGQIALAVLVLAGAGLVTKTLARLQQLDLGYVPDRLLIAELVWPADKFSDVRRTIAMYDRLVPAIQQMPGVVNASPLLTTPFSGTGGWDGMFTPEGQSADAGRKNRWLNMEVASPGYFETVGVKLLRGRVFTEADRKGALPVLVVSEGTARTLWPGQNAVGKRLSLTSGEDLWTVIGVVADTRYREFRNPRATVYFPLQQIPFPYAPSMLILRTRGDPASIVPELRRTIASVDPDIVLATATPMPRLLDAPLAQPRLNAVLLTFFAAVVVVLAAVGLYGVLAWTVRQRTRELGIRIALGADPRRVRQLVVRRGMLLAICGAVAGLTAAVLTTRAVQALLFEVSPADPVTYVGVTALIAVVGFGASAIPARRATKVDPVVALRAEG